MNKSIILSVKHLSVSFAQYDTSFRKRDLHVIEDLNLDIHEGEMVAVVGSSGSGKSLLAHSILGILPYNATVGGKTSYMGNPYTQKDAELLRGKEIVLVPQSVSYLDPLMRVGPQIRKGDNSPEAKKRVTQILQNYGLDKNTENLYPFELSGGMARRVLISTAVYENPKLVIADEPTPGLHIDAAKQVLSHFREIADSGAGVLLITHDLELALEVADRVVVFYEGTTIENASPEDFKSQESLQHPYTKALWRAMPKNYSKIHSKEDPQ